MLAGAWRTAPMIAIAAYQVVQPRVRLRSICKGGIGFYPFTELGAQTIRCRREVACRLESDPDAKTKDGRFGMSWKPRHETHAIERVRLLFGFNEPLTAKLLQTASAEIVHSATHDLGFDTIQPAESSVAGIQFNQLQAGQPQILQAQNNKNGKLLKRHIDGDLIEEVGFRDGVFGYVTTTYGRWENLLDRLRCVLLPPLVKLEGSADLRSVMLEYWDSFTFEGRPDDADATRVLKPFEAGIPEGVVQGASQWHSHVGWFEQHNGFPLLVNRNFDITDQDADGETIRVLAIYSMVELRKNDEVIEISGLEGVLDALHRRVAKVFGESLSDEPRDMIGLDLSEYQ